MYSKLKAEKLIVEFQYLLEKEYFPFGIKGRKFIITELKSKLINFPITNFPKHYAKKNANPEYLEQLNLEHSEKNNWIVEVIINDNEDAFPKELNEVLKVLKIKTDIDKIFNE